MSYSRLQFLKKQISQILLSERHHYLKRLENVKRDFLKLAGESRLESNSRRTPSSLSPLSQTPSEAGQGRSDVTETPHESTGLQSNSTSKHPLTKLGRSVKTAQAELDEKAKSAEKNGPSGQTTLSWVAFEQKVSQLEADLRASVSKVEKRRRLQPKIAYDPELPICAKRDEIAQLIRDHQVVIVCGETGSGKSTQLPKICLELGRGILGVIGHTQPRRIAARSVAARIAEELGTSVGRLVGYKIRFSDETGDETLIKLMTDGILLAESQTDPFFNQYDTIIIDEAHERSLNIDFLLGMFQRILSKRKDLKLIITSATIDAKRFAEHFAINGKPAPIIEVSGRSYPIDIRYRPIDELVVSDDDVNDSGHGKSREEDGFEQGLVQAVDELCQMGPGDILIFMPTERDIFETAKLLKGYESSGSRGKRSAEILPLYARLPSSEQQKIFQPSLRRKIVIATNVAESSLTVPGIRYVIDPGTARISRYSVRSKTQRLPIEAISRASADQRAGRCGRVGPGVCIRLYSQEDFQRRDQYTTPEIRRTNLASVILQTKAFHLGAVEKFPFLEAPRAASILDGYKTLYELGALNAQNELTAIGRKLSKLPVDPRIGRMILAAQEEQCLPEMLIITSVMEIQDPRERPHDLHEKADEKHRPFLDENSDFMSYLKIWDFWQDLKNKLSRNQLRKACRENFLSLARMKEWSDIHLQLRQLIREQQWKLVPRRDDREAIHRAILTGLLYGIAKKTETPEYQGTGGGKFYLWPGSGLYRKKHEWVVASERIETSNKYLRTVGKIAPEWIEPLAGHLIKRTYHEPHWNRETGYVHAFEQVTLFGMTIVPKRRINYGPIEPEKAREIFIQRALVEMDFDCELEFYRHNIEILEEAERLQAKLRRYDFLVEPEFFDAFYHQHLPQNVYDRVTLKQWYTRCSSVERSRLFLTLSDVCRDEVNESTRQLFPDSVPTFQGKAIPLEYQYKPGEKDDGLSLVLPVQDVGLVDLRRTHWLVPGLIEQKIVAVLKSLPKEIRRELVPVPDTARQIAQKLSFGEGDFWEVLASEVSHRVGRLVTPSDFQNQQIPSELLMNIRVIDDQGQTVLESRDFKEVQSQLRGKTRQSLAEVHDARWNQDNLISWTCGELPESVQLQRNGLTLKAWPALCDARLLNFEESQRSQEPAARKKTLQNVCLRLFDSENKARQHFRLGLIRLFCLACQRDLKTQARWIPQLDRLKIYAQSIEYFDITTVCSDVIGLNASEVDAVAWPRNEADFQRFVQEGTRRIGGATQDVTFWITRFLENYQAVRLTLEQNRRLFPDAVLDASEQLKNLLPPYFYLLTPWMHLKEFPRYLQAIVLRFEKIKNAGLENDRLATLELDRYRLRYEEMVDRHRNAGISDPQLEWFRWMLEEYRVSLFAQKLGTVMKISAVRLEKQWEKVQQ